MNRKGTAASILAVLALALAGCGASASFTGGDDGGSQVKKDKGPLPDKPKVKIDSSKPRDLKKAKDVKPPKDVKPWPDKKPLKDIKPWPDKKPPKDFKPWPDKKPWPDSKPWPPDSAGGGPDVWPPPTTCAAVAGRPCTSGGNECGNTPNTCLLTSKTKGVCTCACTPDNDQTPLYNEDTCPNLNANICGRVSMASGGTKNFCLRKCVPKLGSNHCAGGMACHPRSTQFVSGKNNQAVCAFYGCETNADCPVLTSKTCSQTKPCSLGQLCIPYNSATDQGHCSNPGSCDKVSNLCGPHNKGKPAAKVGDACSADTDCGHSMSCQVEKNRAAYQKKWNQPCTADGQCCSDSCSGGYCTMGLCTVDNRGGYCVISGCVFAASLPSSACPAGSACNILYAGGLCQKSCSMTASITCRGRAADRFGDYECRAWNTLIISGTPVTSGPVCDFGTGMACDMLMASGLDCTSVGLSPNTTNMTCRSLSNTVRSNKYDSTGFCLDNTASSSSLRSPMPTP